MVFVPIRYIYPSRSPYFRGWTLALGVVWAILLAIIINRLPELSPGLAVASLAFPAYYAALSFWCEIRRVTR